MPPADERELGAVVMAAGLGTRMHSEIPKHLHPLLGRRMVDWVLETANELGAEPLVVVAAPSTATAFGEVEVAVQEEPRGTGDAVRSARAALEGRSRDVLVLSGDTPLLTPGLLRELIATHRRADAWATVLSFEPDDPREYGRVLRNGDGGLAAIVEARDASPEQLAVREVNSSIYVFRAERLWPVLERLTPQNAQGELYLTDTVSLLVEEGGVVAVHKGGDPMETEGVNTRAELADVAAALRDRVNEAHMLAGVTIVDPALDLDRCRRDASSPTRSSIRSPSSAAPRASEPAPRSARTQSSSMRQSVHTRSWGRSVTFAPARCSRRVPKRARS